MFQVLWFRFRTFLKRSAVEEELGDELQFHFDHQLEQYLKSGMSAQQARRQATLRFGGLEQVKDACRDQRRARWGEVLLQDARYALRLLRKQPEFAAAAVLILALGMGANTAIFSVVDAALLQPLPFKDPQGLVVLTEYNAVNQVARTGAPYLDFRAWAAHNSTFEQLAAYWNVSGDGMVFGGPSSPEHVRYSIVTNNFFSVLGISPSQGRAFTAAQANSGASKVFLLSDALWKRNLGGSPSAIGKTFRLDGDTFTLIGILPPGFSFPQNCDIWVPLGVLTPRQLADRISHPFWALGRLKPHTTISAAQLELDLIAKRLASAYPRTNSHWTVRVSPLLDEFTGNIRQSLLVLSGAVVFILLIACASVANLLLARSERRQKEFAIRSALGAGRGRLICQALIESFVLALLSTGLALLFGNWGLHAITALGSGSIPRLQHFSLNGPMLAFAGALSLAATILIGITPALHLSADRSPSSLREGSRGGINLRSRRLRNLLVMAEIAITLSLLCGAGLLLGSFEQLRHVDPGFNPERLISMQIAIPDAQYPKLQQRTQFLDRLLQSLAKLPGVAAVGAINRLPLTGENNWESISLGDHLVTDWSHAPSVEQRNISASYFRAMGIRLVRGALFEENTPTRQPHSVVINQRMADKFWPKADPIGQRLTTMDGPREPLEVIGVVANVKHFGLNADDDPEIYTPYSWWSSASLVIRGVSDPASLIPAIRQQIAALDKDMPVYKIAGMDTVIGRSLASQRFGLQLLTAFATSALLLSAIGIYGLLAFVVSSRQQELGIRLALGASPATILGSVIWGGMRPVLVGLTLGLLGSLALTRFMTSLLFHVSATNPFIFTAAASLLALVALLACWLPAHRATRIDPITALRCD